MIHICFFVLCYQYRDGGGGHWLVRMEWHSARWSVCLPLLIFPCTIKSRSSLLAPAHPGGPGKRAAKRLWCGGGNDWLITHRCSIAERGGCFQWRLFVCQFVCQIVNF